MKYMLNLFCFIIGITPVWASGELSFYTGQDQLPYEREQISEFLLKASMAQYSEEDLKEITPYTEARITQLFDLLSQGKVNILLATGQEKELLGVCWYRKEGETLYMSQTNAVKPELYLAFAAKLFETQKEVTALALKVPQARLALLKSVVLDNLKAHGLTAEVTSAYPDSDDNISGNIKWSYWRLVLEK